MKHFEINKIQIKKQLIGDVSRHAIILSVNMENCSKSKKF